MNLSKLRILSFLLVGLALFLSGCKNVVITEESKPALQKTIVVTDDGFSYTMQQLFESLNDSHLVPKGGEISSNEVVAFLDSLLCDTLANLEAKHIDLSDHPEQRAVFRLRYYDLLLRAYLGEAIYSKFELDSAQIADYYYSHPELYKKKERIHVYHILASPVVIRNGADSLRTRALSQDALEKETIEYIKTAYHELENGRDFREVADEFSHDGMVKRNHGDLGWVDRGTIEDPFDSVAFSMQDGTYSKPFKDKNGWHIIYRVEYAEEGIPEITVDMFQDAGLRLQGEKADEIAKPLLDSLDKEIHLVINEQLLDTNYYFVDKWEWVAVLNDLDTLEVYDVVGMEEPYRRKHRVDNTTTEMKREMIKQAARKMILIQAARAIQVDTLPSIQKEREGIYLKYAKAVVLLESSDPTWYPSDDEVQVYFDRYYKKREVEKPLKIQHIVCEDSVLARFVADQAQSGLDFLDLAEKYYSGEEHLRRRMADFGSISKDDVVAEVFEAASTTPVGLVAEPVKTDYGWEIVKVISRKKERTLSQYRSEIVSKLRAKHDKDVFEAFRDKLYKKYHVRYTSTIPSVVLKPRKDRLN